jgi:hypothetical protein
MGKGRIIFKINSQNNETVLIVKKKCWRSKYGIQTKEACAAPGLG